MFTARRAIVWIALAWAFTGVRATAEALPPAVFENVQDYTYMWWAHGLRDDRKIFNIQTSNYALSFDWDQFALKSLTPLVDPPDEAEALTMSNEAVFDQAHRTQFSDSFDTGIANSPLHGQVADNMLGGTQESTWTAPDGVVYQPHPTQSNMIIVGSYNVAIANHAVDPALTYRMKMKAAVSDGPLESGSADGKFACVSILKDPDKLDFWDTSSGLTVRLFNNSTGNTRLDMFYGRGTTTGNPATDYGGWVGGSLDTGDLDEEGYWPVMLEWRGAGSPSHPLDLKVYVNGHLRAHYENITDLIGGDRVGFAAPYGGCFDDFELIRCVQSPQLECAIEVGEARYKAISIGANYASSKIVDTGKFFQRRWMENIGFESGAPAMVTSGAYRSGVEFAAWPDRLAIIFTVRPAESIVNGALSITLDLDDLYSELYSESGAFALADPDGRGFAFLTAESGATLDLDLENRRCMVRLAVPSWTANTEWAISLILYPFKSQPAETLQQALRSEREPLVITSRPLAPITRSPVTATYSRQQGWYRIGLHNDGAPEGTDEGNRRMERVELTLSNPTPHPRRVRLNFYKEGAVAGITGLSAILRDEESYPTGIPIQISKNWHLQPNQPQRFQGPWYRGLTMLTIPAEQTVVLEYTSVNALWGGLPAASHAFLSLVGWGVNQQWDQAALGSWGESITFDPDVNLQRSMIDDVRPLMVWAMTDQPNTKWTWTNNVGGGDFLVYYDKNNVKQWNSRMRTRFRRYCPNLTEVTYAGQTHDGKIELACTVSLYRTDDIVRGVYSMRYDVLEPVDFNRLAFLQIASDNYNDHTFNKLARGNEDGLIEEWTPVRGGGYYSRTGLAMFGEAPWFSLHESNHHNGGKGAWANRGLIVRHWEARLGGVEAPTPYASVYGTNNGPASAIIELSAPPEVTSLLPGDYVEAVAIHAVMPQFAADFYGPNSNLKAALEQWEDRWEMIRREADCNHLEVSTSRGSVERIYPTVRIRADAFDRAEFTIHGGLAYLPVTISGLSSYRGYVIERFVDENWVEINQADHGRDFWQCDYDAQSKQWEMTYNLSLDTPQDERQAHTFRFMPVSNYDQTSVKDWHYR